MATDCATQEDIETELGIFNPHLVEMADKLQRLTTLHVFLHARGKHEGDGQHDAIVKDIEQTQSDAQRALKAMWS